MSTMARSISTTPTNRHATLRAEQAEALFEAYRAEGLTAIRDGEEKPSNPEVAERVLNTMLTKAIVRKKSDLQEHAITPEDLAAIVFPSATNPTAPEWPDDDDESDAAETTRHV